MRPEIVETRFRKLEEKIRYLEQRVGKLERAMPRDLSRGKR